MVQWLGFCVFTIVCLHSKKKKKNTITVSNKVSNKLLLQWAIIKIRAYKPKNLLLNVLVVKWLRIDIVSNQEDDAKRFLKMNPRIKVIKWNSKKKKKRHKITFQWRRWNGVSWKVEFQLNQEGWCQWG